MCTVCLQNPFWTGRLSCSASPLAHHTSTLSALVTLASYYPLKPSCCSCLVAFALHALLWHALLWGLLGACSSLSCRPLLSSQRQSLVMLSLLNHIPNPITLHSFVLLHSTLFLDILHFFLFIFYLHQLECEFHETRNFVFIILSCYQDIT